MSKKCEWCTFSSWQLDISQVECLGHRTTGEKYYFYFIDYFGPYGPTLSLYICIRQDVWRCVPWLSVSGTCYDTPSSLTYSGPDYGLGIVGKCLGPMTSKGLLKMAAKYFEHVLAHSSPSLGKSIRGWLALRFSCAYPWPKSVRWLKKDVPQLTH